MGLLKSQHQNGRDQGFLEIGGTQISLFIRSDLCFFMAGWDLAASQQTDGLGGGCRQTARNDIPSLSRSFSFFFP